MNRGDPDEPGSSATACDGTDQRGAPRRGRCDIGAYELVKCARRAVDHVGTGGQDNLDGTPGTDVFLLRDGADEAHGGRGDDRICGGGGRDNLFGDAGDDVLDGGSENDTCVGGTGSDKLTSCEN